MLGIVFGVGSVVAMLAVGEGASQQSIDSIKKLGSENIMVTSIKPSSEEGGNTGESRGSLAVYGLLYEDAKRIQETVPGIRTIVPARMTQRVGRVRERQLEMRVVETIPKWFDVVRRPLLDGRVLTETDLQMYANVCVLTEHGVRRLLATEGMVGERIRLASGVFEVVGIVQNESGGAVRAPDSEADVYIPLSTGTKLFGEANIRYSAGGMEGERVELSEIIVCMNGVERVEAGSKAIEAVLRRFHKKVDYKIDVPLALLRETERSKKTYNIVLGAIAGISLLVGGIGIMNIMLASVTERTKEIGIRRAIGARRSLIVVQFLINTCVLSITGGILGLIVGVSIPLLITLFTAMPTLVQPYSLILAFGISVGIGIIFGLYPAMRAADLDPIVALRHE
ncbi:MAG: ABC transporter permease [Kiritimatiellae bacterium]|nr:ABC transporter permease [Kiritimatiellia bacterium]